MSWGHQKNLQVFLNSLGGLGVASPPPRKKIRLDPRTSPPNEPSPSRKRQDINDGSDGPGLERGVNPEGEEEEDEEKEWAEAWREANKKWMRKWNARVREDRKRIGLPEEDEDEDTGAPPEGENPHHGVRKDLISVTIPDASTPRRDDHGGSPVPHPALLTSVTGATAGALFRPTDDDSIIVDSPASMDFGVTNGAPEVEQVPQTKIVTEINKENKEKRRIVSESDNGLLRPSRVSALKKTQSDVPVPQRPTRTTRLKKTQSEVPTRQGKPADEADVSIIIDDDTDEESNQPDIVQRKGSTSRPLKPMKTVPRLVGPINQEDQAPSAKTGGRKRTSGPKKPTKAELRNQFPNIASFARHLSSTASLDMSTVSEAAIQPAIPAEEGPSMKKKRRSSGDSVAARKLFEGQRFLFVNAFEGRLDLELRNRMEKTAQFGAIVQERFVPAYLPPTDEEREPDILGDGTTHIITTNLPATSNPIPMTLKQVLKALGMNNAEQLFGNPESDDLTLSRRKAPWVLRPEWVFKSLTDRFKHSEAMFQIPGARSSIDNAVGATSTTGRKTKSTSNIPLQIAVPGPEIARRIASEPDFARDLERFRKGQPLPEARQKYMEQLIPRGSTHGAVEPEDDDSGAEQDTQQEKEREEIRHKEGNTKSVAGEIDGARQWLPEEEAECQRLNRQWESRRRREKESFAKLKRGERIPPYDAENSEISEFHTTDYAMTSDDNRKPVRGAVPSSAVALDQPIPTTSASSRPSANQEINVTLDSQGFDDLQDEITAVIGEEDLEDDELRTEHEKYQTNRRCWDDDDIIMDYRPDPIDSDDCPSENKDVSVQVRSPSKKQGLARKGDRTSRGFQCEEDNRLGQKNDGINEDICRELERLRDNEREQFKILSYTKAIGKLRNSFQRVDTYEKAIAIVGIGDKNARKIAEIAKTGTHRRITQASAKMGVVSVFEKIYGVGKRLSEKWYDQGARTLDDIRVPSRRRELGIDLSTPQLIGLQVYDDLLSRIPRSEARAIFDAIQIEAHRIDPELEVILMGSYRRSGDLWGHRYGLVILTRNPHDGKTHKGSIKKLIDRLTRAGLIQYTLSAPEDSNALDAKWMGLCRLGGSGVMRRLDILGVPHDERGAAMIYFTGNDLFNRSLRLKARKMGYSLNQRALYKSVIRDRKTNEKITEGTKIAGANEEDIFKILNVTMRPPEQRNP